MSFFIDQICDAVSPTCTRCARLNVPCTGRGQTRYRFKEHFASNATHWETHKKKPSSAVQRRQPAETSPHDLEIVAPAALSSPQSVNSLEIPDVDLQVLPGENKRELRKRFLAALEVDDPMLDISRLADWLTQIPERLGANELLENAASAFLDAFECLQSDAQSSAASPAYAVAMKCLESALKDQHQAKSPNPLAAIFMLSMAQASADYLQGETSR
ncbi:hypothetical protein CRV24_008551 [Beauveria bassiana]|nr:hypothetical protein CRV24_008551 [Beauveria bassiana]